MVIDHLRDDQTVFDVFAARARQRSARSLLEQAAGCTAAATHVLIAANSWWPLAAGFGAYAGYAAWGLLDRRPRSQLSSVASRALALLTTLFAFATIVGMGLAAFTGDAPSPKGTCYDANGRAFACNARGERRQ